MIHETIDTHEAVDLFRRLMDPDSEMRVICLTGESKMGKSHLLTKVFPALAQKEFQARCGIVDLRNDLYNIPKTLQMIADSLNTQLCTHYMEAQRLWIQQANQKPKVEVRGILGIFSRFSFSLKETIKDPHDRNLVLTEQLVKDIGTLDDKFLLLLFDSVNSTKAASVMAKEVRSWLMDTFLVKIVHFRHVRVVIAGHSLPDVNGAYAAKCEGRHLDRIIDEEEYISYCQRVKATLVEQSIRDMAKGCKYVPGYFAELTHNYMQQGGAHG